MGSMVMNDKTPKGDGNFISEIASKIMVNKVMNDKTPKGDGNSKKGIH